MSIYTYFQQATTEGQKKTEWGKRKRRLMDFFIRDVKVKAHVGMKVTPLFKLQLQFSI